jgi:hypothetical protein
MPVERRIRSGLARNAGSVDPDLDRFLGAVQLRARRRVITRRVAAALVVAAAVAVVIVAGPQAWHAVGGLDRPAPVVQPTYKPGTPTLSGTFRRTVGPGGAAVRSNHLAGRWTMRLAGGTIDAVSVPSAFTGMLSAYQYQVHGSEFRTNLFIQDICVNKPAGTYRWARSARTLRFTVVSDPCRARAALLTSGPWQEKS